MTTNSADSNHTEFIPALQYSMLRSKKEPNKPRQ